MSNPFIGEIRIFAGNFAPAGWAFCDGSVLAISEFDTLFSLIGSQYGGDGQATFALPDLRGRLPVHAGRGPGLAYVLGQAFGVETVTLTAAQTPTHTHPIVARSTPGTGTSPVAAVPAASSAGALYANGQPSGGPAMAPTALSSAPGGSQPHSNLMPSQCVSFIISLYGIFPSQG